MKEIPSIEEIKKIALQAGDILIKNFRKDRKKIRKHGKDLKTIYDKISEELIKNRIQKIYNNHSILAEETGFLKKDEDFVWIVDPLDGTSNFMNSNPFFSISIAFAYKNEIIKSVVYAPFLKELYFAEKGKGAFLFDMMRNKKFMLKVSNTKEIEKSYIVSCEGGEKNRKRIAKIFYKIRSKVLDFRKLGSGALECAWVASGRSDAFIVTNISPWDVAAGILLVKEAKGKITDFKNKEWNIFSQSDLIISNKKIHEKLVKLLKNL
jgi:myo-inositol-1(or 4)-monophosphatase